ncbi:hypothetical protein BaRGS_00027923 [Batillaria attramentaria]|uniref:PiggyBac transposable element-derived protein domain-containing protein n=1 Tax=Batillaria attramentaria TaxID=370345 RepID=A0ABD0K1A6_9CAEN
MYLHVSDNTHLDPEDKMSKMRPLLSMISERCLNYFIKKQNMSIDESLIPYYGRHGARQFHLTFDKLFTSFRLVDH